MVPYASRYNGTFPCSYMELVVERTTVVENVDFRALNASFFSLSFRFYRYPTAILILSDFIRMSPRWRRGNLVSTMPGCACRKDALKLSFKLGVRL